MKTLTAKILEKLQSWQKEGLMRTVKIELENYPSWTEKGEPNWKISVYDGNCQACLILDEENMGADWEQLMLKEKLGYARRDVEVLEKKILELENSL